MRILEKTERRLGTKLFLKGDRCVGPKCAMVRRAYAPGVHGSKKGGRRGKSPSEFGELIREKQKMRFFYGLDDSDIKSYVERASQKPGVFDAHLMRMIESRLDVVVRRLGFAPSGRAARQTVVHGHITVNGSTVRSPSYQTKKGDVIGLTERSARTPSFASLSERMRAATPPPWLTADPERKTGTVTGIPERDLSAGVTFDAVKVKEFYSR
ncbi:MAG: 30S ribosomal protein S4 [Candidatus Sungbacteria bacterium]|nr:30S ribosomal protein S4 [Candidatus Sungbacteria bacterium]